MLRPTARPETRRTFRHLFIIGAVVLHLVLLTQVSRAQQAESVGGARSPAAPQPSNSLSVQERAARGEAPLSRLHDFIRVEAAPRHWLPPVTESEFAAPWPDNVRRVGVVRPLPAPLDTFNDSAAYRVPEGEVRLMSVASEGAVSMRLRFENMALPPGARLFVYSIRNPEEVYGPYEGQGPWKDGTLWTPPMEGDAVAIEYFSPSSAEGTAPFNVTQVSHIYVNAVTETVTSSGPADFCHNDVSASYANPAKAVGALQFTVPGGEGYCTGTLLNTKSSSFIPYLITANHCLSTQSVAQTLRVYWNYNTGDFFPTSPTQRTDGATLLATNSTSDFTFVRLTGSVPGGLWFNGWTTSMPAAGTAVTGIHHPNASHKRQSYGNIVPPVCFTNLPGPCQNFLAVDYYSGVTEGGSSGSELLIGPASDPLFVGNLWGGNDACSNPNGYSSYGRFDVTYPFVRDFLEDGGPTPSCPTSSIGIGQTLGGSLATTDCRSPLRGSGFYADRHTFSGVAGQQITVSLSSSAFDTYLYLLGPGGQFLTQDDDGGGGTNSRIVITLPSTGTYTIESTSFPQNVIGSYSLSLSSSCISGAMLVGETAGGSLATTDCRSPLRGSSFYADRHTFSGVAGQQITVSLSSSAFDTYLYLLGPAGQFLAEDDDGGGGFNSRIVITLPANGIYTAESTLYHANATGNYALSIKATTSVLRGFDGPGLFNPSASAFFLKNTPGGGSADFAFFYGPAGFGWTPVSGDWNGDGFDTVGLYDPSTGTFYLRNSHAGGGADIVFSFGPAGAGWRPVVGDWNGDGVDTVGIYNPSASAFFLKNSHSGGSADVAFFYGPAGAGWVPIAGDWNGDGVDSIGLFSPSNGAFFLRNSNSGGSADAAFFYGPAGAGWAPLAGDWDNDGVTTVGLYSPSNGAFFLRNSNSAGPADAAFFYGPGGAGWAPLAGDWNSQ